MVTKPKDPIEEYVDRLFAELGAKRGERCRNPINGGNFMWGDDPISVQKKEAVAALRAREWFAVNGPSDAPSLPLSDGDIQDYREARGLKGIVGFYARSLARVHYDVQRHPSFVDFARGLMAINTGLWGIEKDEVLKERFPPRRLAGMTHGAYWAPPKEYNVTLEEYRRARLRQASFAKTTSK